MHNAIKHPDRPWQNILCLSTPQPGQYIRLYEAIFHHEIGILKRCLRRGSLEAE